MQLANVVADGVYEVLVSVYGERDDGFTQIKSKSLTEYLQSETKRWDELIERYNSGKISKLDMKRIVAINNIIKENKKKCFEELLYLRNELGVERTELFNEFHKTYI